MFFKASVWIAMAVVLALAGLSGYLFIAGRDVDPPDVSDILPSSVPTITEAENMVPVLLGATNCLELANDDRYFLHSCYLKRGWDRRLNNIGDGTRVLTVEEAAAWADRIIATNAALFAAFDEAAKRPRAQYPSDMASTLVRYWDGPPEDPRIWSVWGFEMDTVFYGDLVALRARRMRECGQVETAVRDLLRCGEMFVTLSYRMENGTAVMCFRSPVGPVMSELVSAAVDGELSVGICREIDAALKRWSDDCVAAWRQANRLGVLRAQTMFPYFSAHPEKTMMRVFFLGEDLDRYEIPRWLQKLATGIGWCIYSFPGYRGYLFQPNRSLGEFAELVRAVDVRAFSLPYTAETRTFFGSLGAAHPKETRWTKRNGVGTSMVNGCCSWDRYHNMVGICVFISEANRVAVAAACFRRENGRLPAALEELVPAYLSEVPRDPFDADRPLGYNAEQGTLHTVGAQGFFDGKVRNPYVRYNGLGVGPSHRDEYRYIRRIDGRTLEQPLADAKD